MNDKYTICIVCEHFDTDRKVCKKCGCYMPAKTLLPFAHCPIGKW